MIWERGRFLQNKWSMSIREIRYRTPRVRKVNSISLMTIVEKRSKACCMQHNKQVDRATNRFPEILFRRKKRRKRTGKQTCRAKLICFAAISVLKVNFHGKLFIYQKSNGIISRRHVRKGG